MNPLTPEQHALIASCDKLARSLIRHFVRRWPEIADDLESAGWYLLCRAAADYRPGPNSFASYARYRIFSELRAEVGRFKQRQARYGGSAGPLDDAPDRPDGSADRRLVDEALEGIPDAALLRLHYLDGLNDEEIGARIGRGRINVWRRRGKALRRARQAGSGRNDVDFSRLDGEEIGGLHD